MKMTTRSLINGVAMGSVATLALIFGAIDRAQAATITTLFNTGLDTAGAVGTGAADANYTLLNPAGATIATRAIGIGTSPATTYNGFAGGQGDDTKSAWIGPDNAGLNGVPGNYTYRTTFDLAGLVASTANISGKWNTDNSGVQVLLNGTAVSGATNSGFGSGFSTFNIASGFTSGINTLDFIVNNAGTSSTPTALRVEYANAIADAAATTTAVPEPSDLMGTAFAFGSVVVLKRKFGKKQNISK
jgi:hypothetical protein